MGVNVPVEPAAKESTAEALLGSFTDIAPSDRRSHATVFNYWQSVRGDLQLPLIQDLDPLEISDAGPFSVLLELIGGGEDAEIRHLGQTLKSDLEIERLSEAPNPSLLSRIAAELRTVANSRHVVAFEDEFSTADATTRCWVTLLPFSSTGTLVDYVYCFTSSKTVAKAVGDAPEPAQAEPDSAALAVEEPKTTAEPEDSAAAEVSPEVVDEAESAPSEQESSPVDDDELEATAGPGDPATEDATQKAPIEPKPESATESVVSDTPEGPAASEATEAPQLDRPKEGTMQAKLSEVRAKADEARMAKLRSDAALYEGLSAAYDFALDAEDKPEEYLKLVEEKGLKIQLRSPMTPVVKLAFDGMCDEGLIGQLEGVLAWALKSDLPRGSLAERIEAEGGIAPILAAQK